MSSTRIEGVLPVTVSSVRIPVHSVPERAGGAAVGGTIASMQPPDRATPRWSPDLMWWWDGAKWVPANQAPMPQPPPPQAPPGPPGYYYSVPPPATAGWAPSPGLRTFLLVFLGIDAGLTGLMALFGTLGEIQNISQGEATASGIIFWLVFVALFGLAIVAIVGVARRSPWARWIALADGIVISLTCLGLVLGIPIIVAAARAPLGKPSPPYGMPTVS